MKHAVTTTNNLESVAMEVVVKALHSLHVRRTDLVETLTPTAAGDLVVTKSPETCD